MTSRTLPEREQRIRSILGPRRYFVITGFYYVCASLASSAVATYVYAYHWHSWWAAVTVAFTLGVPCGLVMTSFLGWYAQRNGESGDG